MSGGIYDYIWVKIEELAYELKKPRNHDFDRNFLHHFFMIASKIAHELEHYDSGDKGEETWEEIKKLLEMLLPMLEDYLEVSKK